MPTPSRLSFCVAVLLVAAPLPAPAQAPVSVATGRIEGTVALSPTVAVRKRRIRLYADYGPGSIPVPTRPVADELVNLVVYLDSVPGTAGTAPAPRRLAIEQRNETFVPHMLPVLRGSTVEFPNDDPVFHNVFSLSSARSFDLGRYPKGASKSVRFDRAGIVQVFCHIHADMSAIVLVLENPFFTIPGPGAGRYALDGVPAGDYRLVAWHERIRPVIHRVRVEPGQTTVLDLNIPLPVEPSRP